MRLTGLLASLLALGCATTPASQPSPERLSGSVAVPTVTPLDPGDIEVVEVSERDDPWILDLYALRHPRNFRSLQLVWRAEDGSSSTAWLLVPPGPPPHPTVLVFPILAGSHVVSQALARALLARGYAVARLERNPLELETAEDPAEPIASFVNAVREARRLLGWLETRPEVDSGRLATAGVSLGGVMAATLMGMEPERIRAGFFAMAGGGLPEILYDSTETPVRDFRDRLREREELGSREAFLERIRPASDDVDPLRWSGAIRPDRVLLVSGRFDQVMPPERTRALWEALGRPEWIELPVGHYQLAPFFWYSAGRAADHFDRVLGSDRAVRALDASEQSRHSPAPPPEAR